MLIPIVGDAKRIVGWTDKVPRYHGTILRHPEAEALLGRAITCTYVEIDRGPDALRAGAPPDWNGPWRCLALCGADKALAALYANEIGMTGVGRVGSHGAARRLGH